MDDRASGRIAVQGITKRFGDALAVDHVDLTIEPGEFFTLLGPSGSGKTTLLRMIAGFETPTEGRIELGGVDVTGSPPFDRDVNTVFQDYALFPHMSVLRNVEYGLKVRRVGRAERRQRALEALASVRLAGFEERAPSQLSGGQRQRVALARALVNRPGVLLLDEPLGALDLKLREEMQLELKSLQRDVGITFVFVTHDQDEALSMSDRIAVFNQGRIEQVGTPIEIYDRPATAFVAGFVGTSNLIEGDAARELIGRRGTFLVRPERIELHENGGTAGHSGTVAEVSYVGSETRYLVALSAGPRLVVAEQNRSAGRGPRSRGDHVRLTWADDAVVELTDRDAARAASEMTSTQQEEPA